MLKTHPKLTFPRIFALSAGLLFALTTNAQVNIITDAGFDLGGPLASGTFQYGSTSSDGTPTGTFSGGAWIFSTNAGLIHSASTPFSPPATPAPSGDQFALLQSGATYYDGDFNSYPVAATIGSNSTYAFTAATTYNLSFYQASRGGSGGALDYSVVLSNGQTLFNRTSTTGEGWTQYSTSFTVGTSGNYYISFTTSALGDNTAFVDSISVSTSAVPEPSAYAVLVGLAALGATVILRRRRRSGTASIV
jgi:hypothetical protein